jgi:hypothetical protein
MPPRAREWELAKDISARNNNLINLKTETAILFFFLRFPIQPKT